MMSLRGVGAGGSQSEARDRGASAVEAAIVTPLVMAMLFGIIELGFVFKDYLAVAGAVRAGVRMASASPHNASFAQSAADRVAAIGGAMNFKDVRQLWIYKVNPATATQSWQDKPIGFGDFSNCTTCVKFRWDTSVIPNAFTPITGGPESFLASSQNACSASGPGGPPDRIGVYIQLKHDAFTGLVFNTVTISEASVMTLEPMTVLTGCGAMP
jgi:Flp pilus assembly protein TadG